ncbi:UDP-glucosyltransferase 2 [Amyelois transitella]|uniref:UDP-glucosyltransferase 2 n=1 Tax=Amyelois transitella TaxID=680683 RepID=UPI00298FBB85|nr:UDP-glucosyltransferase 2 [Amyelois transitella]
MAGVSFLVLVTLILGHVSAYKILVVFPVPATSHNILARGVVRSLLHAGHEVTHVTPFPDTNVHPNLHQVDISASAENSHIKDQMNVTRILNGEVKTDFKMLKKFVDLMNKKILSDANLVKLLNDTGQTFDVVIAEWMLTDTNAGLGYVFNCPFIWFSTIEPHSVILSLIDEHTNSAYIPDYRSSNIPPYDFVNRVKELISQAMMIAFRYFYLDSYQNERYKELLSPYSIKRGRPEISFSEIKYNASLILGNSHVSLGLAIRLPQAYKTIGGYHIETEVKPLPDELKNILDNTKNGLIYFSMGSNLKSKDFPELLKKGLLEIFGGLKQTVLWKFEEVLPNLPPNVHIVNWAPQQSILAHPNCILFITHGGLLSTTEAVHFGKPIIGIPVFADQFNNIDKAVKKGFAIRVDLAYDMKDKLKVAIDKFLRNGRYTKKAKELSLIYHDRPVHPSKELVHWVEHVVKTRGAPHLRSPALDVPVYQKLYLDLFVVILVVLYALKTIVVKIFCSKKIVSKKLKRN